MSACVSSMYIHGIESIDIRAVAIGEACWAAININGSETAINLSFENKKAFNDFVEKNNVTIEGEGNE